MNVDNLLKVKALILEEPLRFYMGLWGTGYCNWREAPKCGTVACIAGWAAIQAEIETGKVKRPQVALTRIDNKDESIEEQACEFLDLDEEQGSVLFFERRWPRDLMKRLRNEEDGTLAYAQVASEAIDRFIACGGDWSKDQPVEAQV